MFPDFSFCAHLIMKEIFFVLEVIRFFNNITILDFMSMFINYLSK